MKLYRCYVMPMLEWPGPNGESLSQPIEKEKKWYPEEEKQNLYLKFKYLETKTDTIYFKTKYEECGVLRCDNCTHDTTAAEASNIYDSYQELYQALNHMKEE